MRLDPRTPLVISTHDLGRRAGSMRTLALTIPAPADLGIEVLGVPEGSPLDVTARLEAVLEGVLVSGRAEATVAGQCARCLDRVEEQLDVAFQELYVYPESDADDDEASRLDNELLDLEPTVRDAIVLALPFQPLCNPDCSGLCLECGTKLDEGDHAHGEDVDPRWMALAALTNSAADAPRNRAGSETEE